MGNPGAQSIDRSSALLVSILQSTNAIRLADLVRIHQLPKSTASRMLASLESAELVLRDRDGFFHPGPAITRYANSGRIGTSVIAQFRSLLEAIAALTEESVNLAIPGTGSVELIDQIDGRYLLGARNWIGTTIPYHVSALGKIFFAYELIDLADYLSQNPLTSFTTKSITSADALEVEIKKVRKQGFATIVDELEEGLTAIAFPLIGANDKVIAAVSISGPSTRMQTQVLEGIARSIPKLISSHSHRVSTAKKRKGAA